MWNHCVFPNTEEGSTLLLCRKMSLTGRERLIRTRLIRSST